VSAAPVHGAVVPGYPRYVRIMGRPINSYKLLLCVGIYFGALATAALASSSGYSPLRFGLAGMACALSGILGARLYFLIVNASHFASRRSLAGLWDGREGGLGVFGGLIPLILTALAAAKWLGISASGLLDHLAFGILIGGFWIRLGCVFNGCCGGRETHGPLCVQLHDTEGVIKPRIPVQFLEMASWLLGAAGFLMLWPGLLPDGSYMLAVMAWYGSVRFVLEPLRELPDIVFGRVRINQLIAAALAITSGAALIFRGWA
jgi:phosphatidylglycerol---prolipoprotein diacylglyceryl transferase